MSFIPVLSVTALYLVTLLGDGCIVIAMAVVATMGGSPWAWGASFALFHALYSLLGLVVASEISVYSEFLGDLFALLGSLILVSHFVHHRLHHGAHGDCSCENHEPKPASIGTMLSTAATLSVHALAAGPIVQRALGEGQSSLVAPVVLASSCMLGVIISCIVLLGETQRLRILHSLDKLPALVSVTLCAVSCFLLFHALEELHEFSTLEMALFLILSLTASITLGVITHDRTSNAPKVVQISSRKA